MMTEGKRAQEVYSERIAHFAQVHTRQKRVSRLLSNLRFLVFFLGGGGFIYLLYQEQYRASGICLTVALVFFLFFVIRHEAMKRTVQQTYCFIQVNEAALARLQGKWTEFADEGKEFCDPDHPYSSDLDLFGQASVFQWVNATTTFRGRKKLQELLASPIAEFDGTNAELVAGAIHERQEAIRELAEKLDWRQRFQVDGMMTSGGRLDPTLLLAWAARKEKRLIPDWQIPFIYGLTAITVGWVTWALFIAPVPSATAVIPLLTQLALTQIRRKRITGIFQEFIKYKHTVKVYEQLLQTLGNEVFHSEYMQKVKMELIAENGQMAATQIKKLGKILDFLDIRNVPMYHVLFNALVNWDYHCLLALERWKASSGSAFPGWIEALAKVEALSSLAILHFDHPDWAFPQIVRNSGTHKQEQTCQHFVAKALGHPLLPDESRVCNDLAMEGSGTILLITGSNMSGKSTLLRTVGVNLVLAYAGAPVAAEEMQCALMKLYTSMRVNDNLEKSISSFYAELLRVKMMIEAAQKPEPMLFLLDELFRGTNSRDRHAGAKTVLRNLSRAGTMGLVSTHDLELGSLETDKGQKIKNYHFTESYSGDQICFDYKLQPGVSTTSNAIYLMKMIGIDVVEE